MLFLVLVLITFSRQILRHGKMTTFKVLDARCTQKHCHLHLPEWHFRKRASKKFEIYKNKTKIYSKENIKRTINRKRVISCFNRSYSFGFFILTFNSHRNISSNYHLVIIQLVNLLNIVIFNFYLTYNSNDKSRNQLKLYRS